MVELQQSVAQLKAKRAQPQLPPITSGMDTVAEQKAALRSPKAEAYLSPVNQNGSFEFDRVIKSGYLQKRTKAKTWRSIFLVLRPNTLSIYKSEKEEKLQYQVFLSELSAVALLRDPKQRRQHVFGLFSPSRNYHLQANTDADAEDWVNRIRQEARIEEEEEEMFLASPAVRRQSYAFTTSVNAAQNRERERTREHEREHMPSSSPEPQIPTPRRPSPQRQPNNCPESSGWSGNELASSDCYSDGDVQVRPLGMSFDAMDIGGQSPPRFSASPKAIGARTVRPLGAATMRNASQVSAISAMSAGSLETDPDRVIWQGWLWLLRSKGGVRKWKNSWAVLRPRNLILYKDESEYAARFILALPSIVNVVERDPISRHKKHCMEIITEEKSYRFSAHDEEALLQCLGAFKSLLTKRRELEIRVAAAAAPPGLVLPEQDPQGQASHAFHVAQALQVQPLVAA